MGSISKKMIALVSAATISLAGCEGMSDSEQTVGGGALALGLAGGLLGALTGDRDTMIRGMAIGAAAGTIAGGIVASRKEQYASRSAMISGEQRLISRQISSTQRATKKLRSASKIMSAEIAKHNASATSDAERTRLAKVGTEAKRKELVTAKSALAATDKELKIAEATLREARSSGASSSEVSGWTKRIASLKSTRAELAREIDSYTAGGWRL